MASVLLFVVVESPRLKVLIRLVGVAASSALPAGVLKFCVTLTEIMAILDDKFPVLVVQLGVVLEV